MKSNYDVIVIGGGIVGASSAYHLVRGGSSTLLIDRHDAGRATSAGAGILAPEISTRDEVWFRLATAAVDYYPTLLQMLVQDGGGEAGYSRCGMLLVAVSEDERASYESSKRKIFQRQKERNFPPAEELHVVNSREAKTLFPPLATDVIGAIYFENAARINGRLMEQSLRKAADRQGLETLAENAKELIVRDGSVVGVRVGQDLLRAEAVLIAGGAWSPALGQQLKLNLQVSPQRGQIAHLDLPNPETGNWPIVNAFHGHYIVCWPQTNGMGRIVVGATRETGSGFQAVTSVCGIIETLSEALRVAPGLADAQLHEFRVGLRPLSADGLPYLGAVPGVQGAFVATGHGPTGLQLGPYSGKLLADLILNLPVNVDLHPFRIDR